ncbi:MAG: fatty acyl-AMP ligase, partial [Alphaproteobacteria bacterium]
MDDGLPRRYADFDTLTEAVDYAARGKRGLNFHSARGEVEEVLPYSALRERAIDVAKRLLSLKLRRGAR